MGRVSAQLRKFFDRPRRARSSSDSTEGVALRDIDHLYWPCERLILERVATRAEIYTSYNISDVMDANDALDAWKEAEAAAYKKANKQ
jgi:hypothetical protein